MPRLPAANPVGWLSHEGLRLPRTRGHARRSKLSTRARTGMPRKTVGDSAPHTMAATAAAPAAVAAVSICAAVQRESQSGGAQNVQAASSALLKLWHTRTLPWRTPCWTLSCVVSNLCKLQAASIACAAPTPRGFARRATASPRAEPRFAPASQSTRVSSLLFSSSRPCSG